MAEGNVLQIIVFAILLGLAINIAGAAGQRIKDIFDWLAEVIYKLTAIVISLAPYGVFALMAWVAGTYGLDVLLPLGTVIVAVYVGCVVQAVLVYGGAIGLIAACDMAIAASNARLALSEVRLGLIPAMISPYVLRAIGTRQAHRWFLTGEAMDAATAMRIGLVHEVAEDGALEAVAEKLIAALLAGGPFAQAEIKRLLRRVTGRGSAPDESMLNDTARWIAKIRAGDEARDGLTAFLERRKPRWIAGE
jgi:1,4-dihydroxy-2-naphthoyl-CoA synthase